MFILYAPETGVFLERLRTRRNSSVLLAALECQYGFLDQLKDKGLITKDIETLLKYDLDSTILIPCSSYEQNKNYLLLFSYLTKFKKKKSQRMLLNLLTMTGQSHLAVLFTEFGGEL